MRQSNKQCPGTNFPNAVASLGADFRQNQITNGLPKKELQHTLKHVPKKLFAFFDFDMLQLFDFERVPIDQMVPFVRDAL